MFIGVKQKYLYNGESLLFMGNKILTRPNEVCLVCDSAELKDPNTMRKFMYCGRNCCDSANMKINIYATPLPKNQKGRRNTRELCLTYFILREKNEFLTSSQIFENVIDIFGHRVLGRRAKSFNSLFHYFENLERVKMRGVYHFKIKDTSVSFKNALKAKYKVYVWGED